jgi:hypothetical protein
MLSDKSVISEIPYKLSDIDWNKIFEEVDTMKRLLAHYRFRCIQIEREVRTELAVETSKQLQDSELTIRQHYSTFIDSLQSHYIQKLKSLEESNMDLRLSTRKMQEKLNSRKQELDILKEKNSHLETQMVSQQRENLEQIATIADLKTRLSRTKYELESAKSRSKKDSSPYISPKQNPLACININTVTSKSPKKMNSPKADFFDNAQTELSPTQKNPQKKRVLETVATSPTHSKKQKIFSSDKKHDDEIICSVSRNKSPRPALQKQPRRLFLFADENNATIISRELTSRELTLTTEKLPDYTPIVKRRSLVKN